MNNKVDKEIEIQFLLAQQIVELKSELKEERKMCNFYIEYSKKLESKLKEAEERNEFLTSRLIKEKRKANNLNHKLKLIKDSLMSDEEIWKRYSAEKNGQWELNLQFKRGIQTQRERTKKAIG